MAVNFSTYKISAVNRMYNRRLLPKRVCNHLLDSETKSGFAQRINDYFDNKLETNSELTNIIQNQGFIDAEQIPLIKSIQTGIETFTINISKILSQKDTNSDVLELKKQIKSEFDTRNLFLDNNKAFAKKIQKALRIIKENNLPLPDEIIVNSILDFSMGVANNNRKTIILNPKIADNLYFSTESPLHMIIHECVHIGQPDNAEIKYKKMPEVYKKTTDNLSLYANDNFLLDVHAELKAKQLLAHKEFTQDEQKALDYIENLFKEYI